LAAPLAAISARAILADQLLRAWIEDRGARRKGKGLKIGEGLPATLAAIAATDLLQITERLLAQAAPVLAGPELQHLVERIRKIADLKGCHPKTCVWNDPMHAVYLHFACSKARRSAGQLAKADACPSCACRYQPLHAAVGLQLVLGKKTGIGFRHQGEAGDLGAELQQLQGQNARHDKVPNTS
jgi:hypothetical protein